jgi:hypothetical protein
MVEIAVGRLAAAARALMLAGRWDQAAELLDGVIEAGEAERAFLAVAAAEVAVDRDFWLRTYGGAPALERATAAVGSASGELGFDLEFLRLKHDYGAELAGPDGGPPHRGPQGRDPVLLDELTRRSSWLRDTAPDQGRRAWAGFYAGLIADVLRGDDEAGRRFYLTALEDGEQAGDGLIVSYAVRHLGFLALAAGDTALARRHWERSRELRQREGCVPLVLAQQVALAELARDDGDPAAARAVAAEVGAWARALGRTWLEAAAAELLPS